MGRIAILLVSIALLGTVPALAVDPIGRARSAQLRQDWHTELGRLEREIKIHEMRYVASMDRAQKFREQATWNQFHNQTRANSLIKRANREEKYALDSKKRAEFLIQQRDKMLKLHGQPAKPEVTPW